MVSTKASRLTEKGQVTIPKAIRDRLRLKPGDQIEFIEERGVVQVRRKVDMEAYKATMQKWVGFLKDYEGQSSDDLVDEMRGPRLTGEDIEELRHDPALAREPESP